MKSLGSFLRYARKSKGFTQDQVAERLGVVTPVLSKWENDKGSPTLSVLCKLCNILEISLEDCIACEKISSELPPAEFREETLGNTLKDLRIKNGWSQAEVGKKMFVTSQTVSKWEKGGVASLDILQRFAELYELSPTALAKGDLSNTDIKEQTVAHGEKTARTRDKRLLRRIALITAVVVIALGVTAVALILKRCRHREADPVAELSLALPVDDACVYRTHGEMFYNQSLGHYYAHQGIDFKTGKGAAVYAVANGTVYEITADEAASGIVIDCGENILVRYSHVIPENLSVGTAVTKGEVIATVSETVMGDEWQDGPHLHFEIRSDGQSIDPLKYLPSVNIETLPQVQPSEPEQPGEPSTGDNGTEDEPPQEPSPDDPEPDPDPKPDPDPEPPQEEENPYCLPAQGMVSENFSETHSGVDFSAKDGAPVYAVADGVVETVDYLDDSGCIEVTIDHGNGVKSVYRYICSDWLSEGTSVKKGEMIGTVQMPWFYQGEPHLHFEMSVNGTAVDPLVYLPDIDD